MLSFKIVVAPFCRALDMPASSQSRSMSWRMVAGLTLTTATFDLLMGAPFTGVSSARQPSERPLGSSEILVFGGGNRPRCGALQNPGFAGSLRSALASFVVHL